ncbi:MAG TPA: glycosyltransferase family 2 protein [Patescibacteria group bacterium]|nr:glycosyltransferase family 2 protein [Patescibacteria group bacterium]
MKQISSLSIFFPFWNEEANIERVVLSAIPIAKKVAKEWEILIIDDGSSDGTLRIAQKLSTKDKHIRVIAHKENRGYGAALKTGLTSAKYEYIVFTDGDGQFDFSEVTKFIEEIGSADIVIGNRMQRHDHPFRHLLMNLLKVWDYVFFGFYFKDIDCGFKMFTKNAVKKILPLSSEGAMITTEILAKAIRAKLKIVQVDVHHYPRKAGDQSGGNIRVIIRAIRESLFLWKELHGRA